MRTRGVIEELTLPSLISLAQLLNLDLSSTVAVG